MNKLFYFQIELYMGYKWPDFIRIGDDCIQRHVGPRHVDSPLGAHDISAAGISDLSGTYDISRSAFACHVVFFTLSGEGILRSSQLRHRLYPGSMMLVPAGCAARYSLGGITWRIMWFDINDSERWSYLRSGGIDVRDSPDGTDFLLNAMEGLYEELRSGYAGGVDLAELLASEINLRLVRMLCPGKKLVSSSRLGLQRLLMSVENRPQFPWNVAALAREIGVSSSHLYYLCREHLGSSPMQLVYDVRMRRACELLRETLAPISQIAEAVGYADARNFATAFRRERGISPREFRKMPVSGD